MNRVTVYSLLRWGLVIGWMVVIFLLSNESADGSQARSDTIVELSRSLGLSGSAEVRSTAIRKSAHVVAYMVLGGLVVWALAGHRRVTLKVIGGSVIIAGLFAVSDEFHQSFVPGRSAEVRDVLIDTAGATVGAGIVGYISMRRQKNFTTSEKSAKISK